MVRLHADGMIRIDDRLPRIGAYLAGQPGVAAAFLYGSYGTPAQTPLSDVDIAVLFRPDAVPDACRATAIAGEVQAIGRHDDINVEVLNRLPLRIQFEVLRTGRALCTPDPDALADFRERVARRYLDWQVDEAQILRDCLQSLGEAYAIGRSRQDRAQIAPD